nr:reverse transcriptase domain-containing protein [Tanacetum cinerariifolium]
MLPVTQIDTFYNDLTLRHRDTINAAAGGTFMKRCPKECYDLIENMTAYHNDWDTSAQRITPNCETCGGPHSFNDCPATVGQTQNVYAAGAYQGGTFMKRCPKECYDLIENMTAYHNDWDTSAQRSESSGPITSSFDTEIAALKVKTAEINKNLVRVLQPPLAKPRTYMLREPIKFMKMNTASSSCLGTLLGNTITNPKEELNGITTRSGTTYQGPMIPTTSSFLPSVVERETETTKDTVHPTNNGSTKDVQPSVVQTESLILNSEPVVAPIIEPVAAPVSAPKPNQKLSIPYPSRLHDKKLHDKANDQREKFFQIFKDLNFNISFTDALILMSKFGLTIKSLLTIKDKLYELARTSLNEHCSAVLLKKLPKKLGDPDKFLIPCDFPKMVKCLALADLGEDFEAVVQHQRRVNPKIHDVIKNEVFKILDAGLIYPISDSPWVSPMLERLAGNEFYCFLDGFSGYFQIPIDPRDQEKTTVEKTMEVFMDDFSVFGNSFENCLSRLDKMLQSVKTDSTPIETQKPLVKDEEAVDVDVTPKTSHLHVVKRIFRYLKGQPKLGLWYPKVSSFDLETNSDSDYAGANLDRKSTTGVFHSKTKHIEIRHHFIRDAYEKKLIQFTMSNTHQELASLEANGFCKELVSPKQTDLSKDISNPLMAASPTIRTSCIKQFWTTAKVKTINDEVRIQALIDKKRVNIKESSIRRTLKLDDAEGTSCLANAEIFDVPKQPFGMNLADLWHQQSFVLLQIRSSTSQAGDMSHHKDIYDNLSLTKKVFANMKRVGTGFSRVVTPLFDNMLVPAAKEVGLIQDDVQSISIHIEPSTSKPHKKHKSKKQQTQAPKVPSIKPSPEHRLPSPFNDPLSGGKDSLKLTELMNLCTHLSNKVLELESKVIDIKSTYKERIKKLEGRVDRLEEENRGRIIEDINEDVEINLEEAQAKPYRMDLEHPEKVLSMQDVDDEEPAKVEEVLEVVTAAKLITEVSVPRRKRGVVIQDPEKTTSTVVVHSEVQSKDKGKGILIEEPKSLKGQAQIEQDEAFHYNYNQEFLEEVNEEVMVPEKEVKVKGHKREGESLEKEITKKQKMDKEKEELKSHLQIVSNDDDVYIESTPLASKIPIVDYKIHLERNKPYFKIIRADGNHMLFLSFSTLLKNFYREDLESLWKLVKERFQKIEPKNYTDDYLLKLLRQCLNNLMLKPVYREIKRRYPLTHFTLEQMLNTVRLEVEEESKISLALLSAAA